MSRERQLVAGLRDELITAEVAEALALLASDRVDVSVVDEVRRSSGWVDICCGLPGGSEHPPQRTRCLERGTGERGHRCTRRRIRRRPSGDAGAGSERRSWRYWAGWPLPARASIDPLSTSELMVNGAGEPSLGSVLQQELRCADEVDLICAFVGYKGIEALRDDLRALVDRGGRSE